MPRVHVIEGPVGAGKSTFAATLAPRVKGVHIALDEWFARLFSPDRPGGNFASSVLSFLDQPRDIRRQRVRLINNEKGSTFSMVVPDHVFEVASDMWEAPDDIEQSEIAIEYVHVG